MLSFHVRKMLAENCHNLYVRNVKYICACRTTSWERLFSSNSSQKPDFYEKLGLNRSANQADIKKAYYDLTLKYHPDRNKDNVEAAKKFTEVTEAYEVLGNYGMRKRYDKGMPIMQENSSPTVKTDIVEPEVKYQSFFDSRSITSRTQTKRKILDDSEPFNNPFKTTSDNKNSEKNFEESKGQRNLIVLAFAVILSYAVISKKLQGD